MSVIKFLKDAVKQTATIVQNEIGEDVQTWVDGDAIKVLILPLSSKYARELQGVTESSTHICFTLSNLTPNERIKCGAVVYLIQTFEEWKSHNQSVLERLP